jgi:AraC-like DNA-binding protein
MIRAESISTGHHLVNAQPIGPCCCNGATAGCARCTAPSSPKATRRSITDIAMSFGFWHLGRFSGGYAALFGCVPTETPRRVRGEFEDEALAPPVSPAAEAEPRKSRDRGIARVTPW